jgi:hypothetical protein
LFHLKNRLKTRVALIEQLDLSGIAVGNVGVPTCLIEGKNTYTGAMDVMNREITPEFYNGDFFDQFT